MKIKVGETYTSEQLVYNAKRGTVVQSHGLYHRSVGLLRADGWKLQSINHNLSTWDEMNLCKTDNEKGWIVLYAPEEPVEIKPTFSVGNIITGKQWDEELPVGSIGRFYAGYTTSYNEFYVKCIDGYGWTNDDVHYCCGYEKCQPTNRKIELLYINDGVKS